VGAEGRSLGARIVVRQHVNAHSRPRWMEDST
jgi:hypothetical protein